MPFLFKAIPLLLNNWSEGEAASRVRKRKKRIKMKRKTTCNYAKLFTQSFQFSCVLTCSCAELSLRLSSLRRASSSICALFFFSTCSLCFRFATFLFWSFTCLLIRGKKNHTIIYMHWKKNILFTYLYHCHQGIAWKPTKSSCCKNFPTLSNALLPRVANC